MDDYRERMRERRIRSDAIERLIAVLTHNARDPERIGRRVLIAEWALSREKEFPKLLTLAEKLGVSEAAASRSVSAFCEALERMRNVKESAPEDRRG